MEKLLEKILYQMEVQTLILRHINDKMKPRTRQIRKKDVGEYTEDFEKFWKEYPKNGNSGAGSKPIAQSYWTRDKLELEKVLEALNRYKKCEQWKNLTIPHASSWLNKKLWESPPVKAVYQPEKPKPPESVIAEKPQRSEDTAKMIEQLRKHVPK